jgi:hypothetical protein
VVAFQKALRLAREQRVLAWELRAATSLVSCMAGDPRVDEAKAVLGEVCAQFKEGHDSSELLAAAELLR